MLALRLSGCIIPTQPDQNGRKRHAGARPAQVPEVWQQQIRSPRHATNDSLVTCSRCGAGIGRWGDVRIGILDEAKEEKSARKGKRRRAAA